MTTKTLVSEARAFGATDVDERHIGYLCRQGVLPHARRAPGVNGGWAYPAITPLQLRAYLPLRQRTSLKESRFMLWLDGFHVEAELARATMVTYLSKAARHWRAELSEHGSPSDLAEAIGTVLAKARSRAPIPHIVDMPLEERQRAYRWLAEQMIVGEASGDVGVPAFERAIGRRDKKGVLYPEFADDPDFPGTLPQIDPETLLAATQGATKLELELMRRVVHMQVVYGPVMLRHLAWEMKSASPFFQMFTALPSQEPKLLIGIVAAGLAGLNAKRDQPSHEEDLRMHCENVESGKVGLGLLEEFRDMTFLEALPEIDRLRIALELQRRERSHAA